MAIFSEVRKHLRLLLGDPASLQAWLDHPSPGRLAWLAFIVVGGCASYGVSVGFWRAPEMAGYVAVKMPLLIVLTLACNGLLNGMLSLLLGSGIGFRGSLLALLFGFAVAALILAGLSPVAWFLALNAPSHEAENAARAHAVYLLFHTTVVAYAGIVANLHLYALLRSGVADERSARVTLLAWLAGNGFVGAQFSWVLRPFFGSPHLEVQFLRDDPWSGNFYLAVWSALYRLTGDFAVVILCLIGAAAAALVTIFLSAPNPSPHNYEN